VFAKYRPQAYPFSFEATLKVNRLVGGIPSDPKVAEGWLRTKLGEDKDDLIRSMVAEVMAERKIDVEEATAIVDMKKHLNDFKKDDQLGLYIEGRQVKAAIKEAANIRWPKERWGPSRKGTLSFFAEHVFVQEDRIFLDTDEPTGIAQRFVHTWRGSGIQYEEYVDNAFVSFTVATDHDFAEKEWALLWLTGEQQGVGATRSQGYGRYEVIGWERIDS